MHSIKNREIAQREINTYSNIKTTKTIIFVKEREKKRGRKGATAISLEREELSPKVKYIKFPVVNKIYEIFMKRVNCIQQKLSVPERAQMLELVNKDFKSAIEPFSKS